jgi:peptidoglycan LD-endopeptidase CwlK
MASRDIKDLIPEFMPLAKQLLESCQMRGIEMRPFHTLRDPFEQARLWRQSRTTAEVKRKTAEFREAGAGFLAFCLDSVGKHFGRHVTDAPPGLSWHQWGESIDCLWVVEGEAEWSTTRMVNGLNGYQVYTEEARKLNLTPGGMFKRFKDFPHVQFRPENNPLIILSLQQINQAMEERFGDMG